MSEAPSDSYKQKTITHIMEAVDTIEKTMMAICDKEPMPKEEKEKDPYARNHLMDAIVTKKVAEMALVDANNIATEEQTLMATEDPAPPVDRPSPKKRKKERMPEQEEKKKKPKKSKPAEQVFIAPAPRVYHPQVWCIDVNGRQLLLSHGKNEHILANDDQIMLFINERATFPISKPLEARVFISPGVSVALYEEYDPSIKRLIGTTTMSNKKGDIVLFLENIKDGKQLVPVRLIVPKSLLHPTDPQL